MRFACRTDANQKDIVEFLEATGFRVLVMKPPCPWDLTVWRVGGRAFLLLEVKTRTGRPTEAQERFFTESQGLPRFFVRSPEAALEAAQAWC